MQRLLMIMRIYHLMMMVAWPILAIPTVLWWKESVLWVAFLSLYANFASEFAAWHGARTEEKQDQANGESSGESSPPKVIFVVVTNEDEVAEAVGRYLADYI